MSRLLLALLAVATAGLSIAAPAPAGQPTLVARALAVAAVVANEREEDVLEGRLLLDVLDLGGREQLLELGQGPVDDDPALVEDRARIGSGRTQP